MSTVMGWLMSMEPVAQAPSFGLDQADGDAEDAGGAGLGGGDGSGSETEPDMVAPVGYAMRPERLWLPSAHMFLPRTMRKYPSCDDTRREGMR